MAAHCAVLVQQQTQPAVLRFLSALGPLLQLVFRERHGRQPDLVEQGVSRGRPLPGLRKCLLGDLHGVSIRRVTDSRPTPAGRFSTRLLKTGTGPAPSPRAAA